MRSKILMTEFASLQCSDVGERCESCPFIRLTSELPETAQHLEDLLDMFGTDELRKTLSGERLPRKLADLIAESQGLESRYEIDFNEEDILSNALVFISRCEDKKGE
jgi:hypothetical protein